MVEEDGGGSINSSGIYTAPETTGTYHIRATSVAYPEKYDRVAVIIVPLEYAKVRVLHASRDAPKVNVWFDDVKVNDILVGEDIDYAQSTDYLPILEGIHSFSLEGVIPEGNSVLFKWNDLDLLPNTNYDLIAVGNLIDSEVMVIQDVNGFNNPADKLRIRFAHMAAAIPD